MLINPSLDKLLLLTILLIKAHQEIMFTLVHFVIWGGGGGQCSDR